MTTPSAHLSERNQIMSVRYFFGENFTPPTEAEPQSVSYGDTVNMEDDDAISAVSVFHNNLNEFGLAVTVRAITRKADDPAQSRILLLCDAIRETFRGGLGGIPMYDFADVTYAADDPEALPTALIVMDARGYRGEPMTQTGVVDEGDVWRKDIIYRCRLREDFAATDHI